MSQDPEDEKTIYKVVFNHEEQYSIWPADRENARGWIDAGKTGTKAECLGYIKGSLDGYETAESSQEDGGSGPVVTYFEFFSVQRNRHGCC